MRENYEVVEDMNVAIVCAIGSNIAKPGVLQEATSALADEKINIICISQSKRQVNMQFVVEMNDFHSAVKAMNEKLCKV